VFNSLQRPLSGSLVLEVDSVEALAMITHVVPLPASNHDPACMPLLRIRATNSDEGLP
jgi:hypothetical protein